MEPHLEELVKSAILGTEKYVPNYGLYGETLAQKITETGIDREDVFLRQCAAAFAYEAAGAVTSPLEGANQAFTGNVGQLANGALERLLETALREENRHVLAYLAFTAAQKQVSAPPYLVPDLLDQTLKYGDPSGHLTALSGAVGQWLSQFNTRWKRLFEAAAEEDFDTAPHAARVAQLEKLRATDPDAALGKLDGVIQQEAADARWDMLFCLRVGLNENDLPFLEKMTKDKSKKVKELAINLLTLQPMSTISQLNLAYLKAAMSIEEKRGLLSTKRQLVFSESAVPDPLLFQLGLEKISSEKGVDDHIHQIAQVLGQTHPDILAAQLGTDALTLIELVFQSKQIKTLKPALSKAAEQFGHPVWSKYLLAQGHNSLTMLSHLSQADQLAICGKWLDNPALVGMAVAQFTNHPDYPIIPHDIAVKIIGLIKNARTYFEAPTYTKLGFIFPDSVLPILTQMQKAAQKNDDHPSRHLAQNVGTILQCIQIRQQLQD